MKKIVLLASVIVAMYGCSKSTDGSDTTQQDTTTKYPLEFAADAATKAAGTSNLVLKSDIGVSVFSSTPPAEVASFINSRYLVADIGGKIGLSYNNTLGATGKQTIIEVSPGTYDIYAVGANDGANVTPITLDAVESNSTYATRHGVEYIHAKELGKVVDATGASRQVKLTFERQVAMVEFSFAAGGGVTLPDGTTDDLIVKMPKMRLPEATAANVATEGVLKLTDGITAPLTGGISALTPIHASKVGEPNLFMYYYILPTDVTTRHSYDVQFTLKVDDGSGNLVDRTFDVLGINLPEITGQTGHYGFEKGKKYTYTINVSNTGLYISEVEVANWVDAPQPPIVAQ